MKKIQDFTINEVRELAMKTLPNSDDNFIFNLSLSELFELIEDAESSYVEDINEMEYVTSKHMPNRKKKEKLRRKKVIMYKKSKSKKWMEKGSKIKKVKDSEFDINNRSYLKKASSSYLKLKPNVSH